MQTQVQVQQEGIVSNTEPNEVVLKNKFSCEKVELSVEGFICKNKAFLLINTELPCGTYDLTIGELSFPVRVKNG